MNRKIKKTIMIILVVLSLILVGCKNENNPTPKEEPEEVCDHIFEKVKGKAATCTESGYQGYHKCVICGYSEDYQEISALGHEYVLKKGKMATLKEDGCSDYYECKRCGDIKDKEIYPKLDHIHTGKVLSTQERTNKQCEIRTCKCDICGKEYQEYGNALNREEKYMDDLNILMIGNSFTNYNCLYTLLGVMIEAEGINVNIKKCANGGAYLYNYCDEERGTYHKSLMDILKQKQYDIIFLQEQSNAPALARAEFYKAVRELCSYVDLYDTRVIMYQTWSYRNGYSGMDYYEMTQKLAAGYEAIANELDLGISRVGNAFYFMYQNHPEINLNKESDGSHPTSLGTYIAALVHYATIYGRSPIGIKYTYNDYIKNENIEWHGDTTRSEISASLQREIEEYAYQAAFGGSIVDDKYKTSSVGIGK